MPPQGKNKTKYFGKLGEDYAEKLLRKKGYEIIEKNFWTKFGEIDIVAVYKNTLTFVEVKTRWSKKYGKPEESVTKRKLNRLQRLAEYYSLTHPRLPKRLRIDVVAIEVDKGEVVSAKIISSG